MDEGDTLVDEVAGGDLTDEVDGCGLRAGEEGTRRQRARGREETRSSVSARDDEEVRGPREVELQQALGHGSEGSALIRSGLSAESI